MRCSCNQSGILYIIFMFSIEILNKNLGFGYDLCIRAIDLNF